MKLDVKEFLIKISAWINGIGFSGATDYTSALYSATSSNPWTAPASGVMVIYSETSGGGRAYWYVNDKTDGIGVARATRLETANYQLGASFPVVKGHKYYSEKSGLTTVRHANLYRIVGGG